MSNVNKKLEYRDCLTNEMLHKRFTSLFDLVRFAIKNAEYRVESGHVDEYQDGTLATDILSEIAEGRLVQGQEYGQGEREREEEEQALAAQDVKGKRKGKEKEKEKGKGKEKLAIDDDDDEEDAPKTKSKKKIKV